MELGVEEAAGGSPPSSPPSVPSSCSPTGVEEAAGGSPPSSPPSVPSSGVYPPTRAVTSSACLAASRTSGAGSPSRRSSGHSARGKNPPRRMNSRPPTRAAAPTPSAASDTKRAFSRTVAASESNPPTSDANRVGVEPSPSPPVPRPVRRARSRRRSSTDVGRFHTSSRRYSSSTARAVAVASRRRTARVASRRRTARVSRATVASDSAVCSTSASRRSAAPRSVSLSATTCAHAPRRHIDVDDSSPSFAEDVSKVSLSASRRAATSAGRAPRYPPSARATAAISP